MSGTHESVSYTNVPFCLFASMCERNRRYLGLN